MAMTLRMTEDDTERLRARATQEGRPMQEVALTAVREYLENRSTRLATFAERVRTEDAELLDRLSR